MCIYILTNLRYANRIVKILFCFYENIESYKLMQRLHVNYEKVSEARSRTREIRVKADRINHSTTSDCCLNINFPYLYIYILDLIYLQRIICAFPT